MNYKDTLNLPKTSFSMRGDLPNREPEQLKYWEKIDLYKLLRTQGKNRPTFILHDGPPYANGDIHIGHAVNKILKDIIIKTKTLSGFNAPYIPGWDCHGLPIELQVEKNLGRASRTANPQNFRKSCRHFAEKQVDKQRADFKRLGVIGDWEKPYLTMNYKTEAEIIRALGKILAAGHIHKGFKPVHWCTDCGSALAEAEVEYENKTSLAVDVRFSVVEEESLLSRCHYVPEHTGTGQISVVIWTTTPWTLPANHAVAVHPDFEYVVVQCEDGQFGQERLLIAESLLKNCMVSYGIEHYHVIAYCRGDNLEGLKLQHPFYDRQVPVIVGEHVTAEAGTGAVHTAPGHGQEDYVVGARYNLPVDNPVGADGRFLENTPLFANMHVFDADEKVINTLKARGKLLREERITHSYPHCWRHKTPIIFRATPQWFISMSKQHLRESCLNAVKTVYWIPDWGQQRITGMIENRPDWCISRQRTWGVPIALFMHKKTHTLHPRTAELIEQVAQRVEQGGIEAWFDLDSQEILGNESTQYEKVPDTLDVWFDSGVTHASVLEQYTDLSLPADLYLEGSDQHRGWFQSSLVSSVAMRNGQAPYKSVLTHGFTVDAQGRKMSKSLGNVVAPQQVIKSLGADVLRLWVAATDYRGEIAVSNEILTRIADAYRRLRNTARYLLANTYDFNPETDCLQAEQMLALDRWIVNRAWQLQQEIIKACDEYQFHLVYQKVYHFCSIDLGSQYLDIIKDRQYTCQTRSIARRSAQTAMYHIAEALVRWLSPILSFTAEEIWQHLPNRKMPSVFLTTWYEGLFSFDESEVAKWHTFLKMRDVVGKELEKLRVAGKIGSSLDAEVDIYCDSVLYAQLIALNDEVRFILITSYARVHSAEERTESAIAGENFWVEVTPCEKPKCVRCWHHREDVGSNAEHPELCSRCVENVMGTGEKRLFA